MKAKFLALSAMICSSVIAGDDLQHTHENHDGHDHHSHSGHIHEATIDVHDNRKHGHSLECGHKSRVVNGTNEYLHDGHWHHQHGTHFHETHD